MTKTRRRAVRLSIASSAVALALLVATGPARADEFDSLLTQLNQASAELKTFQQEAPKKVDEILALKAKHQAEYDALDQQSKAISADGASIDAQAPSVRSLCQGTYPEDQLAAANARCDAALGPFNARVQSYNARLDTLKQKYAELDTRENARVQQGQAIEKQYTSLKSRVDSLSRALAVAAKTRCMSNASGGSPEEIAHQQSVCFDNASAQITTLIGGTPPKPPSSAAPNRTPQQAIDEYRNSGPAQPTTRTRKTSAPPPPPPPGN